MQEKPAISKISEEKKDKLKELIFGSEPLYTQHKYKEEGRTFYLREITELKKKHNIELTIEKRNDEANPSKKHIVILEVEYIKDLNKRMNFLDIGLLPNLHYSESTLSICPLQDDFNKYLKPILEFYKQYKDNKENDNLATFFKNAEYIPYAYQLTSEMVDNIKEHAPNKLREGFVEKVSGNKLGQESARSDL